MGARRSNGWGGIQLGVMASPSAWFGSSRAAVLPSLWSRSPAGSLRRLRLVHFPIPPLLVGRRDRLLRGAQELAGVAARTSMGFVPCVRSVCPPPFSGCSLRPRNAEARCCGFFPQPRPSACPPNNLWVRVERVQRVAVSGMLASLVLCSSGCLASAAVCQGADSRIYRALGVDGE